MPYKDPEKRRIARIRNRERILVQKREHYQRHSASIRAKQQMYATAHREEARERSRQWRAENPEKHQAGREAYAASHAEEIRAKARAYYHANKAQILAKKEAQYHAAPARAEEAAIREARAAERLHTLPARLERRRAYDRQHKAEIFASDPERSRIHRRRRYAANPEKFLAQSRRWRHAHPEIVHRHNQAWAKAHPEKRRIHRQAYEARKRGAKVCDLTEAQWLELQAAYDHRCVYCGKRRKGKLTQDHLTAVTKSGNHTVHNVLPACGSCNSKKHTGPVLKPVQPLLLTVASARKPRKPKA